MFLRNSFCGMLALSVIACGRLKRARERALSGNVVTAIYFHNPNKRLFVRCVNWLIQHGYTFISANELLEFLRRGEKPSRGAVWLSFDDGFKDFRYDLLPVIRQHKIPVTLFIPSGIIAGDGVFPWLRAGSGDHDTRHALTVADLKAVACHPEVTIGAHTVSHAVTPSLNPEMACVEFEVSKRVLELWTGTKVKCFAYPEGLFDGSERAFLTKFDYHLATTTQNALITDKTDPYLVPRFSVADNIWFPEAMCNMVGIWRPAIDPVIRFMRRLRPKVRPPRKALEIQIIPKNQQSA
jgi:peptidoglycan/xylan/chitin deacetylase (PgdA/CDA1 family)